MKNCLTNKERLVVTIPLSPRFGALFAVMVPPGLATAKRNAGDTLAERDDRLEANRALVSDTLALRKFKGGFVQVQPVDPLAMGPMRRERPQKASLMFFLTGKDKSQPITAELLRQLAKAPMSLLELEGAKRDDLTKPGILLGRGTPMPLGQPEGALVSERDKEGRLAEHYWQPLAPRHLKALAQLLPFRARGASSGPNGQ